MGFSLARRNIIGGDSAIKFQNDNPDRFVLGQVPEIVDDGLLQMDLIVIALEAGDGDREDFGVRLREGPPLKVALVCEGEHHDDCTAKGDRSNDEPVYDCAPPRTQMAHEETEENPSKSWFQLRRRWSFALAASHG